MISHDEALRRVDERFARRLGEPDDLIPMETVRLMAVGTDVNGVELQRQLEATALTAAEMLQEGHALGAALAGALAQLFWLGFEYGREEES